MGMADQVIGRLHRGLGGPREVIEAGVRAVEPVVVESVARGGQAVEDDRWLVAAKVDQALRSDPRTGPPSGGMAAIVALLRGEDYRPPKPQPRSKRARPSTTTTTSTTTTRSKSKQQRPSSPPLRASHPRSDHTLGIIVDHIRDIENKLEEHENVMLQMNASVDSIADDVAEIALVSSANQSAHAIDASVGSTTTTTPYPNDNDLPPDDGHHNYTSPYSPRNRSTAAVPPRCPVSPPRPSHSRGRDAHSSSLRLISNPRQRVRRGRSRETTRHAPFSKLRFGSESGARPRIPHVPSLRLLDRQSEMTPPLRSYTSTDPLRPFSPLVIERQMSREARRRKHHGTSRRSRNRTVVAPFSPLPRT